VCFGIGCAGGPGTNKKKYLTLITNPAFMKKITVRVENDHDAELLNKLLRETKFKAKVESYIEDDDLDDEELQLLEERVEEYRKDPAKAKSLDQVKELLRNKYGL